MQNNDRSLFWIEPAAVTALLERLESDPSARAVPEPSVPEPSAPEPSAPGPASDTKSGGIRAVSANKRSEEPDFRAPDGPLEDRLDGLLAWLGDLSDCDQAFVADGEGLALVDRGARPELVAAVASVGERWAEMRGSWGLPRGPSLTIDLEGDDKLYLLLAESRWGRLNLGFVTRRALERPTLDRVAAAFRTAVSEQGETPS